MMIMGFTGTRQGMTDYQLAQVRQCLITHQCTILHHGDCVGADAEADAIARELGIAIVVHPPINGVFRAHVAPGASVTLLPALGYLARNRRIVEAAECLLACPAQDSIQGGTWHTIKYAQKIGKPVTIIPWIAMEIDMAGHYTWKGEPHAHLSS